MSLQDIFEYQAEACAKLGSPFTARILRVAKRLLDENTAVSKRLNNWDGDPSTGADSVPLRLAGALHGLVLSGQSAELAAVYPPQTPSDEDLYLALRTAFSEHEAHIQQWLNSAPQTNESARSAPLTAAAHLLVAKYNLPLHLLELGASAGLNLRWDHVALDLGSRHLGPLDAPLTLSPDWKGDLPVTQQLKILSRAGVDLNPLDPTQAQDRLRLMAYVWPDQPDRLARMETALHLAHEVPAKITKSDAIDWLQHQLEHRGTDAITVIFNTVAWQYFPIDKQEAGQKLIERHGKSATANAPLVWLSMENDNTGPGAVLSLRIWPDGQVIPLGRADFHGRWVQWDVGSTLPTA